MANKYKYNLTIEVAHWVEGSGWSYKQPVHCDLINCPDWDVEGFAEWITEGADLDAMADDETADDLYSYTITDTDTDEVTDTGKVWASTAAKYARGDIDIID